ncbi:TetR/AcrR family transcriptional regulator [Saccharothrix mutabilis subsp. mutabilis]|uniref:TetR/AcrR family transcriptional regulator n=1 Tax=Saccharothrix mutabilis subsp. mutabilis TaxID=66855 RepID=A0ABP3CLD5_9PSEU
MARRQAPDTKQRILAVAARLFGRHGVRSVGMQRLVDETGLGKSLVYREFSSKDYLVAEWLKETDAAWGEYADAATRPHEGDPARQMLALVEFIHDSVLADDFYGCVFYNTIAEFRDEDHPGRRAAVAHLERVRALLAHYGRDAGAEDPEGLADTLLLIIGGLLVNGTAFAGKGPAEHAVPTAAAIIRQACPATAGSALG